MWSWKRDSWASGLEDEEGFMAFFEVKEQVERFSAEVEAC